MTTKDMINHLLSGQSMSPKVSRQMARRLEHALDFELATRIAATQSLSLSHADDKCRVCGEACGALSAKELFCSLWHDLYPGSWERNEWVWVYEFERTERPAGWPGN